MSSPGLPPSPRLRRALEIAAAPRPWRRRDRAIQYSRDCCAYMRGLWDTGCPAFAGHDSVGTEVRIHAAQTRPSFARDTPSERRGRRECRVLSRTRSPVCKGRKHTSRHHRCSRNIDIPCAMVLTLIDALSPVSMTLLVTVACRSSSTDLTPAQGCQDHTPSQSASHRNVKRCYASIASRAQHS
jgi:hypothetical protein